MASKVRLDLKWFIPVAQSDISGLEDLIQRAEGIQLGCESPTWIKLDTESRITRFEQFGFWPQLQEVMNLNLPKFFEGETYEWEVREYHIEQWGDEVRVDWESQLEAVVVCSVWIEMPLKRELFYFVDNLASRCSKDYVSTYWNSACCLVVDTYDEE